MRLLATASIHDHKGVPMFRVLLLATDSPRNLEQLYLAAIPTALPEVRSGIRIRNKTAS
jgi:hypothetical protein